MYKEVEPQNDSKLCLSTSSTRLKISEHQAGGWTRSLIVYAFLAFIAKRASFHETSQRLFIPHKAIEEGQESCDD